jgi:hypothetical protein
VTISVGEVSGNDDVSRIADHLEVSDSVKGVSLLNVGRAAGENVEPAVIEIDAELVSGKGLPVVCERSAVVRQLRTQVEAH